MEMQEMNKQVASLREAANQSDASLLQALDTLRNELDSSKKESEESLQQARLSVKRQADIISARLQKRQEEQKQEFDAQLTEVKSSAEQANAKLTEVSSEVGSVKTDVASTRTDLDRTISDLRRTTGDMGVMSGLIATNQKELAALKALGDREYHEFNLNKAQKQVRIGDILMQVKRTDPKRNKFTVEVVADDKRVEKKDKTVNEPVQFYVLSKARIPYELVVNEVKKDTVVGYLAMPKVKLSAQR
jgi:chromosome segregation ATPase